MKTIHQIAFVLAYSKTALGFSSALRSITSFGIEVLGVFFVLAENKTGYSSCTKESV
jgi:hypothetical protein